MKPSRMISASCLGPGLVTAYSWATLPKNTSMIIRSSNISIPTNTLDSFRKDISSIPTFTETYENSIQPPQYGLGSEWFDQAMDHWSQHFDWRERERSLNRHPHFFANLTGQDGSLYRVHFMALFSQNPDAIPIAFFHGWPGSFLEFMQLLDVVKSRYSPSSSPFHLVVPSLPGFTLTSGPPIDAHWGTSNTSTLMDGLMRGLGFGDGYVAQGGDIGSFVARDLALNSPSCKAVHLNFIPSVKPDSVPPPENDTSLTTEDQAILERSQNFINTEMAYALESGTKPATLGFVLESSPFALLAWIGEKFLAWTDPSVQLSLDEILTSITLYRLTNTISRSLYSYKETSSSLAAEPVPVPKIEKPIGYSRFPFDNSGVPKSWAKELGNLTFFSSHTRGGHFAAMEYPVGLWDDVEEFVTSLFPNGFDS